MKYNPAITGLSVAVAAGALKVILRPVEVKLPLGMTFPVWTSVIFNDKSAFIGEYVPPSTP
jgi:hypothetical protein